MKINETEQEHEEAERLRAVSGVCCGCGKLVPGCTIGTITTYDVAMTFCNDQCFTNWQHRELLEFGPTVVTWRVVYATTDYHTLRGKIV